MKKNWCFKYCIEINIERHLVHLMETFLKKKQKSNKEDKFMFKTITSLI